MTNCCQELCQKHVKYPIQLRVELIRATSRQNFLRSPNWPLQSDILADCPFHLSRLTCTQENVKATAMAHESMMIKAFWRIANHHQIDADIFISSDCGRADGRQDTICRAPCLLL